MFVFVAMNMALGCPIEPGDATEEPNVAEPTSTSGMRTSQYVQQYAIFLLQIRGPVSAPVHSWGANLAAQSGEPIQNKR